MKKNLQLLIICLFISAASIAQNASTVKIDELTSQSFKQKVWNFESSKTFLSKSKIPVILDFHATWCRPCKMLAPHLQEIQKKYAGKLIVYKIDVDKEPELAKLFRVEAMPTIVFISGKNKYTSELGYKDYNEFEVLVKSKFNLK